MTSRRILTGILIPSAAMVTEAKEKKEEDFKCRASELPIYSAEVKSDSETQQKVHTKPGLIEKTFGKIRVRVFTVIDQVKHYQTVTEDAIEDSISNAEWLVEYLGKEDSDQTHKAGAIAIGGLTGLIFGLRGGFFRRALFTSAGALGMASICYPQEAAEYSGYALEEAKKYSTIGYNFIYGVKKDDPPLELPSLPQSFSEAWDLVSGANKLKSVSEFPPPTEEEGKK